MLKHFGCFASGNNNKYLIFLVFFSAETGQEKNTARDQAMPYLNLIGYGNGGKSCDHKA